MPNALQFTYQNLKSCKPHEKTKQKTSKWSIDGKLKTKDLMCFVSFFSCDLEDFKFLYLNPKAFGTSFLYWVDFNDVPLLFNLTHVRSKGKNPLNKFFCFLGDFWDYLTFSYETAAEYCDIDFHLDLVLLSCCPQYWIG